jgi:hypothetical protein
MSATRMTPRRHPDLVRQLECLVRELRHLEARLRALCRLTGSDTQEGPVRTTPRRTARHLTLARPPARLADPPDPSQEARR